jgi:hypothetical protein
VRTDQGRKQIWQLATVGHGQAVELTSEREEIAVPADVLARYVGVYAMGPGVNMNITLADGQLISQMTGQGKIPLFAESQNMFFPKVVNAQIEFPRDDLNGPASQLTLHQNGRDMVAKRLDEFRACECNAPAVAATSTDDHRSGHVAAVAVQGCGPGWCRYLSGQIWLGIDGKVESANVRQAE